MSDCVCAAMTVDDLFPEEEGECDHPLMALFERMDSERDSFFEALNRIHRQVYGHDVPKFSEDGTPLTDLDGRVVDTPTPPSATLTG